ncbi:exonuclease domain-containing protein [Levilactobacillus parabrevis]|uniref:exonuclease domain-containing protein n=1 Tax=Levilactobacillus parabrevis TaxID=357278 RepID=UPI003756C179
MEDYVAIDVETANASRASICAIGIAQFKRGELTNSFYSLINPHEPFADRNTAIHGIDANLVATAPTFSDLLPLLHRWLDHQLIVSHTNFDISALRQTLAKHGQPQLPFKYFDSYIVCQQLIAYPHHRLADMAAYFGIHSAHEHHALSDAQTCGHIIASLVAQLEVPTLNSLLNAAGFHQLGVSSQLEQKKFQKTSVLDLMDISHDVKTATFEKFTPAALFYQRNVVLTGNLQLMTRATAFQKITAVGGTPQHTLTATTNFLVVGHTNPQVVGNDGKSPKIRKAEELNRIFPVITIIGESDFLKAIAQ